MLLKGKRVLVTGADGFIGSHLVEALIDEGCKVKAFIYYNAFNSWGWLDTFSKDKLDEIEVFAGDIREPHGVEVAVQGCDIIFHLAALIGIPFSYYSPDSYVNTNIKGTLNVLQAGKKLGTQKILVTSTSEVYGTARYVPIDENHPFQGQSPYSATKIGADKMAEAFYRSFELPVVIIRPFNTYGPRQSARAVIPTIIIQLLSGVQEIRLGSLFPTRDFIYVLDTVSGFIEVAKSDHTVGEEINVATGVEIAIEDVAHEIMRQINPKARIKCESRRIRPEKSEVERLVGCTKKLEALTPWRPKYDLTHGLEETIAWFRVRKNLQRYKAEIYNI